MPKIPYKSDKSGENEDDYEIVSFEDFCDKSPSSKTDLLTLNDNINYRLCYENDKTRLSAVGTSRETEQLKETSLNGSINGNGKKKLPNSFAPFGKYTGKADRSPLFSGVIPKPRNEGESTTREHRYQRFSDQRNMFLRCWEYVPRLGSGCLAVLLISFLCVAGWWTVSSALDNAPEVDHYRKLWERIHPNATKNSPTPTHESVEYRYHDHNNLNTKNKNSTDKKKEHNKKSVYPDRTPEYIQDMCAQVEDSRRFDCLPMGNEAQCIQRGCCWQPTSIQGAPYCFYPAQYDSFRFLNMTEDKHALTIYYEQARPSGYPDDFQIARMDFRYLSDDILQIKIYDAEHKRFEPPYPEISMVSKPLFKMKYRVQVDTTMVGFKVIRNADNVTIIDTQDVGGLILSDKFLQLSAILPTDRIYGLGEKRAKFKNDMNWQTFAIFNRDRVPVEGVNLYGSHPFYVAVEADGKSHGTLLLNSNAMDIVLQPTPAITYRAIGGVLNFLVVVGSSPRAVVAQYTELVGRPFMPPYWALGFHLCKFNYGNLNVTRDVWQKNREAGIPFDVQWNDIDYMHKQNDFTYDTERYAGLPQFVKELHNAGMHYMLIIDPGISASETPGTYPPFDRGLDMDIFIKNSTNQPFVGKVWNSGTTVFPDFTHPNSTAYWVEMMSNFHKLVPYDGAWIDMNEPANFLDGPVDGQCEPEGLPYTPRLQAATLSAHSICMDARHYAGIHFDWHNLYALTEAIATNFALTEIRGKRPMIISRASFVGLGHVAGHWSGDIASEWHDMRATIPELLSFSLFGIPMMGADICGFRGNTTVELCTRWMQLGAFYPFSRNHNSDTSTPQDPVSLGPQVVEASRKALRIRYTLLPYYYTLFWRAHVYGDTVIRPLFFESPLDPGSFDSEEQFLVGPHVLVSPILYSGATTTKAYFPGPHRWYDFLEGRFLTTNGTMELTEHETVSVKGGAVIPLQEPPARGPVSTAVTRGAPLQLLAAPCPHRKARGELYWDDGDSLHSYQEKKYSHIFFSLNSTQLTSNVTWWGYGVPSLNKITVLDQPSIKSVDVNDSPCRKPCEFIYYTATRVLQIHVNLSLDRPFSVTWAYQPKIFRTGNVA